MICTDPESVIVTLEADDALIGDRVLERLAVEYERGADVTVGSMLRTDKAADYPVVSTDRAKGAQATSGGTCARFASGSSTPFRTPFA